MPWNWELPDWPQFTYDPTQIISIEQSFLLGEGGTRAYLRNISQEDHFQFIVEILSSEGVESSKIEGENLDRASLQSSIQQHFGIHPRQQGERTPESRLATLLCNVYDTFDITLNHETLFAWHAELMSNQPHLEVIGGYRSHEDPMQIVSTRLGAEKVYFEAPPSSRVESEMDAFIHWFNESRLSSSVLGRAAMAHIYFESIHPFEDGNGRIGRLLIEKSLSQGIQQPILLALSKVFEKRKKEYYRALERCNHTLDVTPWVVFFAEAAQQAHQEAMALLRFLVEKSKLLSVLIGKINPRQEKALLRLFAEGPEGFKGGLSAEKYIAITKASRATATRDLNELVAMSALKKTGELRHTRYWLPF